MEVALTRHVHFNPKRCNADAEVVEGVARDTRPGMCKKRDLSHNPPGSRQQGTALE